MVNALPPAPTGKREKGLTWVISSYVHNYEVPPVELKHSCAVCLDQCCTATVLFQSAHNSQLKLPLVPRVLTCVQRAGSSGTNQDLWVYNQARERKSLMSTKTKAEKGAHYTKRVAGDLQGLHPCFCTITCIIQVTKERTDHCFLCLHE